MALKVKIHMKLDGFGEKTSKIEIPKSWLTKSVKDVIGLFAKGYNAKNPDTLIDVESVHLQSEEGVDIPSDAVVDEVLEDRMDYFIHLGVVLKPQEVKEEIDPSLIRCRNYGCNLFFREEENHDTACKHHTGPPIFHDTMKCWSCCKDIKKAYDFETFQLIEGCHIGRHSLIPPTVTIADSPNASSATTATATSETPPVALKQISDFNTNNPEAATAASSALKSLQTRKSSRNEDGITAKCQRKGCQQTFVLTENHPSACCYHKGQAVFHDVAKYWSCCADKKCYDFDDFMKVPGCTNGLHDDGVIELND